MTDDPSFVQIALTSRSSVKSSSALQSLKSLPLEDGFFRDERAMGRLMKRALTFEDESRVTAVLGIVEKGVKCSGMRLETVKAFSHSALRGASSVQHYSTRESLHLLKILCTILKTENGKGTTKPQLNFLASDILRAAVIIDTQSSSRKTDESLTRILVRTMELVDWLPDSLMTSAETAFNSSQTTEAFVVLRALNEMQRKSSDGKAKGISADLSVRSLKLLTTVAMRWGSLYGQRFAKEARSLLASYSSVEVENDFFPLVIKSLLRERESAVGALPYLLDALSIDITFAVEKTLVPTLLACIKLPKGKEGCSTISLARAIFKKCLDPVGIQMIVQALINMINAKATSAPQRTLAAQALAEFRAPGEEVDPVVQSLVPEVVNALENWLSGRESNQEARNAGLEVLVQWLAIGKLEPGKEVIKMICGILDRKRDVELRTILVAMANTPSFPVCEAICTSLKQLLKAKNVSRVDAARAFVILSRWSAMDDKAVGSVSAEMNIGANASTGPVFGNWRVSSIANYTDEDIRGLVEAAVVLLTESRQYLKEADERAVCIAFTQLAIHPRSSVATSCVAALRNVANSSPTLSLALLNGLWQGEFCGTDGYSSEITYVKEEIDRVVSKLVSAVCACAGKRDASVVPLLLLASHHPKVNRSGRRRSMWNLSRMPEMALWKQAACRIVLSVEGLQSGKQMQIEGACAAIESLAVISPDEIVSTLLPQLVDILSADTVGEFSVEDLRIYKEYVEHLKYGTGNYIVAESAKTSKEINDKGKQPVKKKTASSSQAVSAREKQAQQAALDRQKMLEEAAIAAREEEIKKQQIAERVGSVLVRARAGLMAISALSLSATGEMLYQTSTILPKVLIVARSGAEKDACLYALKCIAACSPTTVDNFADLVSAALYDLQISRNASLSGTLLRRTKARVPPSLKAETLVLLLPVIENVLINAETTDPETVDIGLELLEIHVGKDSVAAALECADAYAGKWLLEVLEREDSLFTRAMQALSDLSENALEVGPKLAQVLVGMHSGKSSVREATIVALDRLADLAIGDCPRDAFTGQCLWLAVHDVDEDLVELAIPLWKQYGHGLVLSEDIGPLLELIAHPEKDVRVAASKSIADALKGEDMSQNRNAAIAKLFRTYMNHLPKKPEEAEGSRVVVRRGGNRPTAPTAVDNGWTVREGVARTLLELATQNSLKLKDVPVVFTFLAARGLGDVHDAVRSCMTSAAVAVVHAAKEKGPQLLLPMIEGQLHRSPQADDTKETLLHIDRTHENLVVCLGTVASYLPAQEEEKIVSIAELLIKTALESQSESVQRASSRCLTSLATALQSKEEEHRDLLLKELFDGSDFCRRKGAAYALAGITRGLGLKSMKRMELLSELQQALGEKTGSKKRQSALFLTETLALSLERLFEPYFVTLLPLLLQSMNDVTDVRQACMHASTAQMRVLSVHGVRLVLPSLVAGLKDRSWRTKAASADLLGAMAFCAPRQLAQSLPLIVPKLAEALADAHPKVVEASEAAVSRIAAVTSNPEVRSLSPFLLAALRDPAGRTAGAIEAMLQTEFIHAVDPASLALLVPPLHRALRERGNEIKKRAAAIVGSMCQHATNPTDVLPYLDFLLPDLRTVLLDPIPDVRKTAALALGSLADGVGEQSLPGLVDWLSASVLNAQYTTAERSGAALGLAAVSAAMTDIRVNSVLNDTLKASSKTKNMADTNAAKEGALLLLSSMPMTLKDRFEIRLSTALPVILRGLADEQDNVREAALTAGRSVVSAFGKSSLDRLLPLLCDSMQDPFWRIRQNSTQLLGDLLLSLAGAKAGVGGSPFAVEPIDTENADGEGGEGGGDDDHDEDEEPNVEDLFVGNAPTVTPAEVREAMTVALGDEGRNEVIATLYLARNDVSTRVRMVALQVWKTVVSNTPRTLREILSAATKQIIHALSRSDEERRAIAARALGDLGQKLGDRVLPQVLPLLRDGLTSEDDGMRRGACEGLAELVASATKLQLQEHAADLLPALEDALCDDLEDVRQSSAAVFASLCKPLGYGVAISVVNDLVDKAAKHERRLEETRRKDMVTAEEEEEDNAEDEEEENYALDGLRLVLSTSGGRLLTSVVNRVMAEQPMSSSGMLAISTAASVSPVAFEVHLKEVVSALVVTFVELTSKTGVAPAEDYRKGAIHLMQGISSAGDDSAKALLVELMSPLSHNVELRISGARLVGLFCEARGAATRPHAAIILEALIRQLADPDMGAVTAAWEALTLLSNNVPARELSLVIGQVRQSLRLAAANSTYSSSDGLEGDRIAGLCLPKGPAPLVPMLTEGLLHGTPELREQAALGIAEVVELSEQKALSPFVVKLTGPLIRVISDRFPWQVKAAILHAMLRLLQRCSPMLKMLVPQLQSIFLKNLADPTRTVRLRALAALAELIKIHQRPEPVVNDLVSLSINADSAPGVRASAISALEIVFRNAPKLPTTVFDTVPVALLQCIPTNEEDVKPILAKAFGSVSTRMTDTGSVVSLMMNIMDYDATSTSAQCNKLHSLRELLRVLSANMDNDDRKRKAKIAAALDTGRLIDEISSGSRSEAANYRREAVLTSAEMYVFNEDSTLLSIITTSISTDPSIDVRVAGLLAAGRCGAAKRDPIDALCETVVAAAHERNTMLKYNADKAIRRLFFEASGAYRLNAVDVAEEKLSTERFSWLTTRLEKLQITPESDNEGDGQD